MNEVLSLILAFAAGLLLGAFFFGGLWWTVRKGVSSRQPVFWFAGSLLVRMGIALAGFYFVGRRHPDRLVVCLVGFVIARLVVSWLAGPSGEKCARPAPEASHAA
jgi:F1F0 ATPase subunit 2